jgi:hypothetical protein
MARHKQSWNMKKMDKARRIGGCAHEPVKFETKRGKTVAFNQTVQTAKCPPRYERPTAAQKAQRRLVAGALETNLKACGKLSKKRYTKHGASKFNRCLGSKIHKLLTGR